MARKIKLNQGAKDVNMSIVAYRQGGQWIVSISKEGMDCRDLTPLHYAIQTKKEVKLWCEGYVEECGCKAELEFE